MLLSTFLFTFIHMAAALYSYSGTTLDQLAAKCFSQAHLTSFVVM